MEHGGAEAWPGAWRDGAGVELVTMHPLRLAIANTQHAAGKPGKRRTVAARYDGGGALASSWQYDDHQRAVLVPIAPGAIPVLIEQLRRLLAEVNLKILLDIDAVPVQFPNGPAQCRDGGARPPRVRAHAAGSGAIPSGSCARLAL